MRFWQLFVRNLKETYRDPLALGFLLAFPLLFTVVFGASLSGNGTPSYNVDFLAPGIIVLSLLIMIPTAVRLLARDKEKGYLARLLTTPTRPWEFILGYTLFMLLVAVAQIIFFMVFAQILGVHINGNIGLVFLVFLLTAIASIGMGMLVASFSKSKNQAEPLTWLFTMLLAWFSGVWFSISFMPRYIQTIVNIFPYAHAVSSAHEILIRGVDIAAVQSDILFLGGWAAGATALGIFFFARTMRS